MDTRNGMTRKVAETENRIWSIQLLSKEHNLALTLECDYEERGKVMMINYSTGTKLQLISTEWYSGAYHWNSLLQILPSQNESDNYTIICREGKYKISKFLLNKKFAHVFK